MAVAGLPEGFVLDEPIVSKPNNKAASLPKGFVLDEQVSADVATENKPNELGLSEKAYNAIVQMAYGANKSLTDTIDFFGTDIINAGLAKMGLPDRLPSATATLDKYAGQSALPEGTLKDVATATGSTAMLGLNTAGALKQGAAMLPKVAQGEGVATGMLRQVGDISPKMIAAETGLSGVSGGGGELGKTVSDNPNLSLAGEIGGAVVAPLTVAGVGGITSSAIRNSLAILKDTRTPSIKQKEQITDLSKKLIIEEAKKSGKTPKEISESLYLMGDEGTLADTDPVLAHAVRVAVNEDAGLQGSISRQLTERTRKQGTRLEAALDESMGTKGGDLTKQIDELDNELQPKIKQLYDDSRNAPLKLSPKLLNMIQEPKGLFKPAAKKAAEKLETREAMGEEITPFDLVDAHKKALDDLIGKAARDGEMDNMRLLVKAKNSMLEEVDSVVPSYKEARMTYAGRESLLAAADLGEQFFKRNTQPRDVQEALKNMSEQEIYFYKLGVKRGIENEIGSADMNRDIIKALLNKGNTNDKLRLLFNDEKQMNKFKQVIENESDFMTTKNIVIGNSTTFRQAKQDEAASKQMLNVATDLNLTNLAKGKQFLGIVRGLDNPTDEEILKQAKIEAGKFLTTEGIDPARVEQLLQNGMEKELKKLLTTSAMRITKKQKTIPTIYGANILDELQNGYSEAQNGK